MQKLFLLALILFISSGGYCQFNHINVLKGKTGNELLTELVTDFKTSVVLDYSIARDTMFSKIDGVNDSLECIYTGMKLYLQPGQDPTESVYLNGLPNGINTEHIWPQGLGATGMAQSDMHHLYPSRAKANSDRGNFIFSEIPDSQTEIWYYKATERTSSPSNGKDLYSEGIRGVNGRFEPRESVKGNIARSIFYFYTMYRSQADNVDPTFFQKMKNDLCEWHYADPVDSIEWTRNQKIAKYQGDKLNPFVLDCSLVSRAYCNNIDQACEALMLSSYSNIPLNGFQLNIFPNPGNGNVFLNITSKINRSVLISCRDTQGKIHYQNTHHIVEGRNIINFDLPSGISGLNYIRIADMNGKSIGSFLYFMQ